MSTVSFFFGHGKLRYWYILFYTFALPVYIFGIYLLIQLKATSQPETRELVLNIFSFGYLFLALFSLINTIIYIKKTKSFLWKFIGFMIFIGVQVAFLRIGITLGNNYQALTLFFTFFLIIAVYGNLKALASIHMNHHIPSTHHKSE